MAQEPLARHAAGKCERFIAQGAQRERCVNAAMCGEPVIRKLRKEAILLSQDGRRLCQRLDDSHFIFAHGRSQGGDAAHAHPAPGDFEV